MNVGELIAELSKLDPNTRVLQAKDEEGNGYHWARYVEPSFILKEDSSRWNVEAVYYPEDFADGEISPDECEPIVLIG